MPRLLAAVLVVVLPGFAPAQPCEFKIVDAKAEKGRVQWTECRTVPVERALSVEVEKDGKKFVEQRRVTVHESVSVVVSYEAKALKATDSAGKPIAAEKLLGLLKESTPVVTSAAPVGEKQRALFKDNVIFVELPPPGGKEG